MHRRFHKRRWTLTCFLAAMVILPTAAVLQKDNDAQNKSAAHAYAEKEGAAQSVSWNVQHPLLRQGHVRQNNFLKHNIFA